MGYFPAPMWQGIPWKEMLAGDRAGYICSPCHPGGLDGLPACAGIHLYRLKRIYVTLHQLKTCSSPKYKPGSTLSNTSAEIPAPVAGIQHLAEIGARVSGWPSGTAGKASCVPQFPHFSRRHPPSSRASSKGNPRGRKAP